MSNDIIPRSKMLSGEVSYDEYYAQFGKRLVTLVEHTIGRDKIIASADPHFNDIPLPRWDNLQPAVMSICGSEIGQANGSGGVSLSDCVCAAKSAAKIIKESVS